MPRCYTQPPNPAAPEAAPRLGGLALVPFFSINGMRTATAPLSDMERRVVLYSDMARRVLLLSAIFWGAVHCSPLDPYFDRTLTRPVPDNRQCYTERGDDGVLSLHWCHCDNPVHDSSICSAMVTSKRSCPLSEDCYATTGRVFPGLGYANCGNLQPMPHRSPDCKSIASSYQTCPCPASR